MQIGFAFSGVFFRFQPIRMTSFQEKFKKSFAPIELEGKLKEEEYDTENVTVQIVELSTDEIVKSNNWIGANKPVYGGDESSDENSDENEEQEEEQIPGFTVTSTKSNKKPIVKEPEENEGEGQVAEEGARKKKFKQIPDHFKSKRGIGQFYWQWKIFGNKMS